MKLQASFTTGMEWRLATPAERGALASLLMYAVRRSLPGMIPNCMAWGDQQWQAAADIDSEDVQQVVDAQLATWAGDDLILEGFDHRGYQQLQTQMAQAPHGKKGGRPKTLRVINAEPPKGSEPITPNPYQSNPIHTRVESRASAEKPTDPDDIDFKPTTATPVRVVQNTRPPVGDLDHLQAAGAFIGRDERGAWQLIVDQRGLEVVKASVVAVKASGKIPYLTAVMADLGVAAQPDEYLVIDGEKIRVTKRK